MTRVSHRRIARLEQASPGDQVHIVFGLDLEDLTRKLAVFEAPCSAGPRDVVYGIRWRTEDEAAAAARVDGFRYTGGNSMEALGFGQPLRPPEGYA